MPPRDQPQELQLDPAPIWPEDDSRLEPAFLSGPQWIEFAETDRLSLEPAHASLETALVVGFDEPDQADLERALQRAEEPPPPPPRRRATAIGVVGSLGLHLLPLVILLLLGWSTAPGELAAAIPVKLVIEAPPPEAPTPEPSPPASTRIASDEIGDAAKTAAPSPKPPPPAPPRPTPPRLAGVAPPPPKATAPVKPAPATPPMARPEPKSQEPARAGRIPGPDASRDDYLAYLVTLTRRHVNLLPMSLVGDRHGETTLSLLVLGDGTIARIAVAQSSGYRDIDERIEQIVAAVRRFPPLPQRFPDPSLELTLRFRFPEAVLGR